jgi:nucleoside-diphosphate-sugar epimerase
LVTKEEKMSQLHVIFGTGPVGCWTAHALCDLGFPVRAINRSGKRPALMPAEVEIITANVSDPQQAIEAAQGAAVLYQALNPPYHQWHEFFPGLQAGAIAAAKATGARYVSIENLYMYDSSNPITEDSPQTPKAKKGELRKKMGEELMAAHRAGEIQATALRSSDYYGPGVEGSAMGAMVFGNLVAGKKAQMGGSDKMPHSWAYIEDVGKAAVLLGTRDEALGKVWIAPHAAPVTQGDMVRMAAAELGVEPKYTVMGTFMMWLGGLFIPEAKASVEMLYEFNAPFVVDSRKFEKTFGLRATPIQTGIKATASWYKSQVG